MPPALAAFYFAVLAGPAPAFNEALCGLSTIRNYASSRQNQREASKAHASATASPYIFDQMGDDHNATHPQPNWRTRLTKVTGFSALQVGNGWHRICRVWHSVIRFPKLFEALLVVVGLLQAGVLLRTDEALHLAANAQQAVADTADKMRSITAATERPWIGPYGARIEGTLERDKRISTIIPYLNTGRQPSSLLITTAPKLFTREQWDSGFASLWIYGKQQSCMAAPSPANLVKTRVAYPTTGFTGYSLRVESDEASLAPSDRFLATDKFMSGDELFIFTGCFVYGTTENPHHSSFCFYYDPKISDIHNLSYCLVGQRAD